MVIGIDFDNTIVCYDQLFHRVAREQGLIPADVPVAKNAVRQHLIRAGREAAWTAMQGHVYGERMLEALPFPGALDFLQRCVRRAIDVYIISHKTRHPYVGPQYDLHGASHAWLECHGFYDPARINLGRERVFFELTKTDKLERIGRLGCRFFVDDLPDILSAATFPAGVRRVLFDPSGAVRHEPSVTRLASWAHAETALIEGGA